MADKVTTSSELSIQLTNEAGNATRTIKIPDPISLDSDTGRAIVTKTLAPLFVYADASSTTVIDSFFFDDDGSNTPLTRVGEIELVTTIKTTRTII